MFLITRIVLCFFAVTAVMGCEGECTMDAAGGPETVQGIELWRSSRGALLHWSSDTVRIPVDPALTARYGAGFPALLERAAQEWAFDPDLPRIAFDHSPTEDDRAAADVKMGNWLGSMEGGLVDGKLAITFATADSHSGQIIAVQVWINMRRPLAELAPDDRTLSGHFDLQGVMTHELGHVLGLGEGPKEDPMTMNPAFKTGEIHQRTLEDPDMDAVLQVYRRRCED